MARLTRRQSTNESYDFSVIKWFSDPIWRPWHAEHMVIHRRSFTKVSWTQGSILKVGLFLPSFLIWVRRFIHFGLLSVSVCVCVCGLLQFQTLEGGAGRTRAKTWQRSFQSLGVAWWGSDLSFSYTGDSSRVWSLVPEQIIPGELSWEIFFTCLTLWT